MTEGRPLLWTPRAVLPELSAWWAFMGNLRQTFETGLANVRLLVGVRAHPQYPKLGVFVLYH